MNSSHVPAFVAILHKTMTTSAPYTLHHKSHAHHQRQLQSVSSSEQSAYSALDGIRADIDRACGLPVLYAGCGAAQCVCLSAAHMSVMSLLPTIPPSASKASINISSVLSARSRQLLFYTLLAFITHDLHRSHDNGVFIQLRHSEHVVVSVSTASSLHLLTALQEITKNSTQQFEQPDVFDNVDDVEPFSPTPPDNTSNGTQQQQHSALFSISSNELELRDVNGTLQWRENVCKIGHFSQIDESLVGITSLHSDLLLQLQSIAQWVLLHCDIVIPVAADPPGDERFLLVVNASLFDVAGSSVAALHRAAVLSRKSSNCDDLDYGYDALKNCANSLPQNETFNSTLLFQIFEPFALSSKTYSVHSSRCARRDNLPPAGLRSPSDVKSDVEIWVSSNTTRRVLALSKHAIMLLSADAAPVANDSCQLQVRLHLFGLFCI